MPVFQKGDKKILFLHTPKCGGTTVEQVLLQNGWSMSFFDDGEGEYPSNTFLRCSPQHFHLQMWRGLARLDAFDFIFTLVRNPVARIVSEFSWRKLHFGIEKPFQIWVIEALQRYKDDPFVHDNHIRPQIEFCGPEVHWYRLENGLSNVFKEISVNTDHELIYTGDIMMSSGPSDGADTDFSKELAECIYDFYNDDFSIFGYEFEV